MKRMTVLLLFAVVFMVTACRGQGDNYAVPPTITWKDADRYLDKDVYVVGKIVRTGIGRSGQCYLNFDEDWKNTLTIFIPKPAIAKFKDPPQDFYKGKTVKVRGKLYVFKDSKVPNIKIEDPAAITILSDDAAILKQVGAPISAPAGKKGEDAIQPEEYTPTIAVQHAPDFLDQQVFLIGKVTRGVELPSGHVSLEVVGEGGKPVRLFIRKDYLPNFPGGPKSMYQGKMVRIHGRLYNFEGKPNISANNPGLIAILPDDAGPPAEPMIPVSIKPTMNATPGSEITIVSYNLLNLFDNVDEPYHDDDKLDAKPRSQLEELARSIRALNADVVAVVEVESRGYLKVFLKTFLSDMGYEPVLIEGNDDRGINVGVLSRFPVGQIVSHQYQRFKDTNDRLIRFSRDLLQVRIEPPGAMAFDVFVTHLKSKGGKEEGFVETRLGEARKAREIFDEILTKDAKAAFVVCGDFNDTIDSEPLKAILGSGSMQLTSFVNDLPDNERITYNQKPHLSMIDFILASPEMAKRYVPQSYRVPQGSPETTGSDHNPVVARFKAK